MRSKLDLEKELTSNQNIAKEEENNRIKEFYTLLKKEIDNIKIPYPEVLGNLSDQYLSGKDDSIDFRFKNTENKPVLEKRSEIKKYYDSPELFIGCCNIDGQDCYFMENNLDTRGYKKDYSSMWINVDDRNCEDSIKRWQFPDSYPEVSISRKIEMKKKQVVDVTVKKDTKNEVTSKISDSFLRNALIRNKNKSGIISIIQTIQEKQNNIRIIPASSSFIVQGCAGSGKTMVLLHRLRYLIFNKDLENNNYFLLVPNNSFASFMNDYFRNFNISEQNVFSIQSYYSYLLNNNKQIDIEKSELIYPSKFLKRIYSKEFMQEAYGSFIQDIAIQMDDLINLCEESLNDLLNTSSAKLKEKIISEQKNAVKLAKDSIQKIKRRLNTKLNNYSDIELLIKEIESEYKKAENTLNNQDSQDIANLTEIYEKVNQDKEIINLKQELFNNDYSQRIENDAEIILIKKELVEAEKKLSKATIFTKNARIKKLDKIKQQYEELYQRKLTTLSNSHDDIKLKYDELYNIKVAELIEKYKQIKKKSLAKSTFIYGNLNLDKASEILNDLNYINTESKNTIDEYNNKINKLTDDILSKYTKEVQLLNQTIESLPNIVDGCRNHIKTLEQCNKQLLEYIQYGVDLASSFSSIVSKKLKSRIEKLKYFSDRSNNENINYFYTMLVNKCKSTIKSKFDLKINTDYKHGLYISLYCKYLTKGIEETARPYLYIDEAQDLSLSELELIRKLNTNKYEENNKLHLKFPTINLFGDTRQNLSEHGISSWNDIDFIKDKYILDENFRNPNQIINYCNNLFSFKMKDVGVDFDDVEEYDNLETMLKFSRIVEHLSELNYIVKDDYALKDLNYLMQLNNIKNFNAYTVLQSKGLEFKRVCVFNIDMTETEKYIAYTRALVGLIIIHNLPALKHNHMSILDNAEDKYNEEK